MSKLPIMATVSRAYGFLLGEFGTIIRLVWAPLLIGVVLSFNFSGAALDAAIKGDEAALAGQTPGQVLISIVAGLGSVMALVALLRVVIFGDRAPGLWVYLWLGQAELRLVVVALLLFVAAIAAGLAAAIVLSFLAVLANAVPGMGLLLTAIVLVGIPALLIWAAARLSLVPSVVVAENNLGVERSWQLMGGNALAMIAVALLTFGPFTIVSGLVYGAIMGADTSALPSFESLAKMSAEELRQVLREYMVVQYRAMRAHWVELHVLNFVSGVITTALSAGAFGSAYNTIVADPQAQREV